MNDITNIAPKEQTIEILHPSSDEPVGISVSLMSPDDPRMKTIKRKITDFNLQKQKRGKVLKAIEVEDNEIALIGATLTGWEWYGDDVSFKGEKPEFNPKNVAAVLKEITWFKKQLSDELDDTKGFF